MASTKAKVIVGLALAVTVAGAVIQMIALRRMVRENDALQRQLATTTHENASAVTVTNSDELDRLRAEHDELVRLRGEVAQLRREREELSRKLTSALAATNKPAMLPQGADNAWVQQMLSAPAALLHGR